MEKRQTGTHTAKQTNTSTSHARTQIQVVTHTDTLRTRTTKQTSHVHTTWKGTHTWMQRYTHTYTPTDISLHAQHGKTHVTWTRTWTEIKGETDRQTNTHIHNTQTDTQPHTQPHIPTTPTSFAFLMHVLFPLIYKLCFLFLGEILRKRNRGEEGKNVVCLG